MFCTGCGAQLADAAQFCTECGQALRPAAQPLKSEPLPQRKAVSPLLVGAAICLTLMVIFQLIGTVTVNLEQNPLALFRDRMRLSGAWDTAVDAALLLWIPMSLVGMTSICLMTVGVWLYIFRAHRSPLGLSLVRVAAMVRMIGHAAMVVLSVAAAFVGLSIAEPFLKDGGFKLGGYEYAMTAKTEDVRLLVFAIAGVVIVWNLLRLSYNLCVLSAVKRLRNRARSLNGSRIVLSTANILFAIIALVSLAVMPFVPQLLDLLLGAAEKLAGGHILLDVSLFAVPIWPILQTAMLLCSLILFCFAFKREQR